MQPENSTMKIGQIAIAVSDVSKALPFYRDLLDLKFLFNPNPIWP